jgi:hypothetical protein
MMRVCRWRRWFEGVDDVGREKVHGETLGRGSEGGYRSHECRSDAIAWARNAEPFALMQWQFTTQLFSPEAHLCAKSLFNIDRNCGQIDFPGQYMYASLAPHPQSSTTTSSNVNASPGGREGHVLLFAKEE